jgi:hypothetical protein
MSKVELTNCQIALNGLFGEISDARRTKIQQLVSKQFPTTIATPAAGILAFTNPMTQEVLVIGPNAFNFTATRATNINIEEVRRIYERLFAEGLLAETITPTVEIGSVVEASQPLQRLKRRAGGAFDAGFNENELIGMGVRKIYRHNHCVVDVRLENNFQGQDRYHGNVRIESEIAYEWREAFDKVASSYQLAVDISKRLDHALVAAEATA